MCNLLISILLLGLLNYGHGQANSNQHEMRIINKCSFSLQIGIRGDDFTPENGGFVLNAGAQRTVWVPHGWTSGRIWGKTNCGSNNCCETGDCGTCKLQCGGLTGTPDVTVAEFGMDQWGNQDYYDVSLVDAFNLRMSIQPIPGTFQKSPFGNAKYDCQVANCLHDLTTDCPAELRKIVKGKTVSCLSACTKFGSLEYCCPLGSPFGSAQTCRSSNYAAYFKKSCPLAYSYAFDDDKSTFTCRGAPNKVTGYITTFCP